MLTSAASRRTGVGMPGDWEAWRTRVGCRFGLEGLKGKCGRLGGRVGYTEGFRGLEKECERLRGRVWDAGGLGGLKDECTIQDEFDWEGNE